MPYGYVSQISAASVALGDGTAVTGTAEASLLPAAANAVIPANYPWRVGTRLKLRASGRISNIVTTPGTLTLRMKLGPTKNINVLASAAMQLNAVVKTNVGWDLDLDIVCRAVGAGTATLLFGQGQWTSESVVGSPLPSAGGAGSHMWQPSAPTTGTGFDSTAASVLDLTAQFSLTGNSIQLHEFALDDLNYVA